MSCRACGFDENASVSEPWTVVLEVSAPSQNQIHGNTKRDTGFKYRAFKNSFRKMLVRNAGHIPPAKNRRRVWLVRQWALGKRAYDKGNLVGGCKALIDCLREARLLIDDTDQYVEIHYRQEPSPTGKDRVQLTFEEFIDG